MLNQDLEKVLNAIESRIFHHQCINESEDFSNSAFVLIELNILKAQLIAMQAEEIKKYSEYFKQAA
jgi:hypothetical protein